MTEPAAAARPRGTAKAHPVIEVFGPTIQGEGPDAGLTCHFVRFGGCDFRCSWCDSMYAVDPEQVRENSVKLTVKDIMTQLQDLPHAPLVILSGGNPALHQLGPLVNRLHEELYEVGVETQGSIWRPWLGKVDQLVVSPKPPSSGMVTPSHSRALDSFMDKANAAEVPVALKIPVFDTVDLAWAKEVFREHGLIENYLSVGTPQPSGGFSSGPYSTAHLRQEVAARYRWLCEEVISDPALGDVKVLPQLHVLAWGAARGV